MKEGALDSFDTPVPKTPCTNASLNQNNESQEYSQSAVCSTTINASNIVSTSFIDIGTVSEYLICLLLITTFLNKSNI